MNASVQISIPLIQCHTQCLHTLYSNMCGHTPTTHRQERETLSMDMHPDTRHKVISLSETLCYMYIYTHKTHRWGWGDGQLLKCAQV